MFVSSTQRIYWVTLHSWVCHLNYSLICLLALPIQNNGLYCTHGCGTYYKVQPMFVSSTQRIYWVTLHSWVCHLNYSLICLLALPIQNNGLYCTRGCGTYYKVQPMFVSSTQRKYWVTLHSWMCHLNYSLVCLLALPIQNNGLYCTHGCGTYYKVQPMFVSSTQRKYWVTLHSQVCHLNYSLICLLALPIQNNGLYCIIGVVPIIRYSLCLLALRIENIGLHCTHGCAT